ncbi:hypothetical protein H5410_037110 [Solanum commersonii]|uniref:Uncharacterized protein n=1 Tax=Solanum commersonii TaxID=4109 RepID=A0A9J5YA86_SOLCO|nr:hypothetical protein H5410_037110 [Solanum commersonii]
MDCNRDDHVNDPEFTKVINERVLDYNFRVLPYFEIWRTLEGNFKEIFRGESSSFGGSVGMNGVLVLRSDPSDHSSSSFYESFEGY